MGLGRIALVALLAAALLTPAGASATFPGRNGVFAVSKNCAPPGYDDHIQLYGRAGRQLDAPTACGSDTWGPDFSPSGRRLSYVDLPDSDETPIRFVVASIDGGTARPLPFDAHPAGRTGPAFAPDGGRVVFAEHVGSGTNATAIHVARTDGSSSRLLWRRGQDHTATDPRWSPDGDEIAFVYQTARGSSIQVVDARTGRSVRTLAPGDFHYDPDWSPDGDRIAYVDEDGIRVVGANGGRSRLTFREGSARFLAPVWSPDGRWIAWIRVDVRTASSGNAHAHFSLWRGPASGGRAERVTALGYMSYDGENEDYNEPDLAWQPRPRR